MTNESPVRILIARRPHPTESSAEEFAAWFARTSPAVIRTVTVLPSIWPSGAPDELGEDYQRWIRKETKKCERAALEALKEACVPDDSLDATPFQFVTAASETDALSAAATNFNATIILLGSHASAPEGRFVAGSTADALLHCAPVSLGLAPRDLRASKKGVTRVNCAYVDTEQSQEALRKACDYAHRWDVPLRLVAFTPHGPSMYPTETLYKHAKEATRQWRDQAQIILERGQERALARFDDLRVDLAIGSGEDWESSITDLDWKKGDLLVVGSSTLGVFGHTFLGSSTNQIVRNSPVPTVIVPV